MKNPCRDCPYRGTPGTFTSFHLDELEELLAEDAETHDCHLLSNAGINTEENYCAGSLLHARLAILGQAPPRGIVIVPLFERVDETGFFCDFV